MSKCDIVIEFDRDDRTFQAGEVISGKVYVTPKTNMPCDGVRVEIMWATHGRGNSDSETIDALEYNGRQFLAGETVAYEFRFDSPGQPLTYHGHYLNVDHYVRARLDVPWSFDPKAAEEYILLPGPACRPADEPRRLTKTGEPHRALGCVLAAVMVVAVVSLLFAFLPVIIIAWAVAAIVGFKLLRNSLAAKRLGETTFSLARDRAAPGETLPVSVEFSPKRSMRINAAIVVLKGVEQVVSGSGTNRTTHTKTLFKKHYALSNEAQLPAGKQMISGNIAIPTTDAWTFQADDNKVIWEMSLRVDIPNWPDWIASTEFELGPNVNETPAQIDALDAQSQPPPIPTPVPPTPPAETPPTQPIAAEIETQHRARPEPEPDQQPKPVSDGLEYAEDLNAIESSDRFGDQRGELIARACERTYNLEVTIKSVSWTLESSMPLEFRNGRTVIAQVEDTDSAEIAVHFPESANEDIDALSMGTTLRLTVRPREFNKFYCRMEALVEEH
ncbi:MAG: hypothetical protein QGG42_12340 [Phycisphaerae bacterium]|jgi:cell division septation protein DedD|nr:hypothetical protein [Phycisphaerae bacterium]